MARKYCKMWLSIWTDPDFRELSPNAKLVFFAACSSPSLSTAGVMDWHPKRLAVATGLTIDATMTACGELVDKLYLVVDTDTDEVLVRSFIRSDEIMRQPNMAKSMVNEFGKVLSLGIRGVVVHELHRLRREEVGVESAWEPVEKILQTRQADPSEYPCGNPSPNPSDNPSGKGSGNPFGECSAGVQNDLFDGKTEAKPGLDDAEPTATKIEGKTAGRNPYGMGSAMGSGNPSGTTNNLQLATNTNTTNNPRENRAEVFDQFWSMCPRKVGKDAARRAFDKAVKRASLDEVMAGMSRFSTDPNLPEDKNYIPHPSTWLNEGRWDDEPLPPRQSPAGQSASSGMQVGDWLRPSQHQQDAIDVFEYRELA